MTEYSIAQARDRFTRILREVESEGTVQLTRRGRPVAVILSSSEYERLRRQSSREHSLFEAIMQWRQDLGDDLPELPEEEVEAWRDRSPGRGVEWPK
jgi:prevent-host-death family protein